MDRLFAKEWESVPFGPFMVPGRIDLAFKCWGETRDEEKMPVIYTPTGCNSQDRLFLGSKFDTGAMLYRYDRIIGKDKLILPRFYSFYEGQYGSGFNTGGTEDDVTRYACNDSFIDLAGKRWKSSFCVRQYKKYRRLYDMQLYMALVGEGKHGLMVTQIAEGISRDNALKLVQKFIGSITARAEDAPATAAPPLQQAAEEETP